MEVEMKQSDVRSAARVVETKKSEPKVLGAVGALLLALAGFFVWQELHLATEVLMVPIAIAAAAIAWLAARKDFTLVGPLALTAVSVVAGTWYGANKEPLLLIAMSIGAVAAIAVAISTSMRERVETASAKFHRMAAWGGVAVAGLITSFAGYFHIFNASESAGMEDFVARRAILSLTWLLSGTALVLFGRARQATEIRDAGFLVLAASVAKLMLYDTTHLDGGIRIGALAVGGAVLVAASFISSRINRVEAARS